MKKIYVLFGILVLSEISIELFFFYRVCYPVWVETRDALNESEEMKEIFGKVKMHKTSIRIDKKASSYRNGNAEFMVNISGTKNEDWKAKARIVVEYNQKWDLTRLSVLMKHNGVEVEQLILHKKDKLDKTTQIVK